MKIVNSASQAARSNNASRASIRTHQIYAKGGFKLVYKGEYTIGQRKGQPCVCKMFESGAVFEDSYFSHEMENVGMSMQIIEKFNEGGFIDKTVYLNDPEVWEFMPDAGEYAGQKNLIEPFIANFEKFNSNTGWTPGGAIPWHLVMQALSHFSYHTMGGQLVLCDLQGGVYENGVILTDPVIMSRRQQYGPTDLGPKGISNFFARHRCNQFCRSAWSKPANATPHFDVRKGTSMMRVPTRNSRAPLSRFDD